MKILTDEQRAAVKDGAEALQYRAERLRHHSEYEDNKPWSERIAKQFERHAKMLEEIAEMEM